MSAGAPAGGSIAFRRSLAVEASDDGVRWARVPLGPRETRQFVGASGRIWVRAVTVGEWVGPDGWRHPNEAGIGYGATVAYIRDDGERAIGAGWREDGRTWCVDGKRTTTVLAWSPVLTIPARFPWEGP